MPTTQSPEATTILTDRDASTLLRIATAGSVDDGKSTLIGRLLHDTKSVMADHVEQVAKASERRHGADGEVDLALLTDGLRAEREQGITIDVAYRYFATPRRSFIIADTPGHVTYTRNMVTGASTAELAIVLVDARNGLVEQSRRHAAISGLLGIRHVVLAINKMDLVDWDEATYNAIVTEFQGVAATVGIGNVTSIPMSARDGDNVVDASDNMPWYSGPTLLEHLETVDVTHALPLAEEAATARLPVQWVIRPGSGEFHDYRGYAGQVARGTFRPGDEVVVLPAGTRTSIASIDTFDGPLDEASAGDAVTLLLSENVDIARGDVITAVANQPQVSRDIAVELCWMHETPLVPGTRYLLKHTTRTVRAAAIEVANRRDVTTMQLDDSISELQMNELGLVHLRTTEPVAWDPYADNRAMGSLILIDEVSGATVAAGMLVRSERRASKHSPNVVLQETSQSRDVRTKLTGLRGATIWVTGLPAAGKSTVAADTARRLVDRGIAAYVLDGDNLRHGLNGDLGFEGVERAEVARRTAHAASLLADAGIIAIVSLVTPYAADRARAREIHEEAGLPFLEVFVDTPLAECEARDPKGLYARARANELTGMTGVDDPYERPTAADLTLTLAPIEVQSGLVIDTLDDAGLLPDA